MKKFTNERNEIKSEGKNTKQLPFKIWYQVNLIGCRNPVILLSITIFHIKKYIIKVEQFQDKQLIINVK